MRLPGMFSFDALMHPAALLLLAGVLVLFIAECIAQAPGAVQISTGETLAQVRRGGRVVMRRLPAILRAVGLALLVIALARPLKGLSPQKDSAEIIDIMLCVDCSGSMRVMDFRSAGQRVNRLEVTKQAVRDFIASRKTNEEDRYGLDRLGLVLYAKYAWTQTPLTLDYAVLEHDLNNAEIVDELNQKKQGTAIGSAIGLAISKLRKSEAKTKIIILLTDGRNNEGELDPLTAAQLAKDYNIRVYTIGAGSTDEVLVPGQTLLGQALMTQTLPIDDVTLRKIADITGGKFFRATDTESLESAYREINRMETTEVELGTYYDYKDVFMPWACSGTVALLSSIFVRRLWFETIP